MRFPLIFLEAFRMMRVACNSLNEVFMVGNNSPLRPPPPTFKTPPYVTATPVMTHRKLDLNSSSRKDSKASIRFLILATDGLWDALSSEEVVSLVGGYLAGVKGVIPKSALATVAPTSTSNPTVDGKSPEMPRREHKSWAFVDENVSTHLIRNALGGGDVYQLRKLVSIPAPHSRNHRDDITVTVVWWEQEQESQGKVTEFTSTRPSPHASALLEK